MTRYFKFTDGKVMPVRTFYGVAKNYSKHAKEMNSVVPSEPMLFLKPPAAYIEDGETIYLPDISNLVHYEVELAVIIAQDCKNINREDAFKYIAGYAVGIDVTLRDLQMKAKNDGSPWTISKAFYTSAPISKVVPQTIYGDTIPNFDLELELNSKIVQKASTTEMERPVDLLIEYLSKVFTLEAGDCILTGTPEGVGQIVSGDKLYAKLLNTIELRVNCK